MDSSAAEFEKPSVDDDDDDYENEKQPSVMVKAANLTNKVHRRMYGRITRQLHSAKLRTKETVERFSFTVDLVNRCLVSLVFDGPKFN